MVMWSILAVGISKWGRSSASWCGERGEPHFGSTTHLKQILRLTQSFALSGVQALAVACVRERDVREKKTRISRVIVGKVALTGE